ncbi:MAG: hypothetical protein WDO16_15700 [Bacteroidota bacterium]
MANTNYPSATPQNQPPAPKSRAGKNLLIGLLAAGLLGTWGYLLYDKNKSSEDLQVAQVQSDRFSSQRDSLDAMLKDAEIRLDSITGSNNNLQGDKSDLQKQIESNKTEIKRILRDKNATAADLKEPSR